ncbi:glycosyltransferase family 1 protein [Actinomadura barringtoniae]|uniref:Glycosyltransferase family 1 protein n=1 Tax=Actinomadura barringtoniae TaxID=1427535 RepID=A0A939T937_9ACTN|nr:glycosyltransferase [Actinomadura barringtoniae]MBO2453849.1 glycosyltransferase family 1 protein [Actinomadura barringtoniae]
MSRRSRRVQVPSLFGEPAKPAEPEVKTSRFLFAVPPLTGHVNPTVAVAAELTRRGHEVAWVGHPGSLEPLLPSGARVFPAEDEAFTAKLEAARRDWMELRGPAALKFLWEEFIVPLGHAMMPGVEAAIDEFEPDVVISDQQVLAAPVAARLRGLPWATSATTSAEFTRPLAGMPKVEEWVREQIADFQLDYDLEDLLDLRFSDHLVLAFSTDAMIGDTSFFPDHFAFVGPALGRPPGGDFPWEWLDGERPAVLVSLGTINGPAGERFFQVAADAVRDLDVQAVFVAPEGAVTEPLPNVLVRDHVPQLALLERLSAVVSHGGHNTVCETLASGLPLVVAPIRDDQPVIAKQVAEAGAGLTVRFTRVQAEELRKAISSVLTEGAYREAAQRVRDSFAAAGGAAQAAERLEKLA